jgi:CHAT domain-containing protein
MDRELRSVGRVLRDRSFDVRVGNERSALDETTGPLGALHIAAHGVFHPLGWLLSGMQLADGWFGFERLRREHLEGALVHFTSCESGRVGRMPGSDIEGWTTAALAAGAREVVLAGWRIDGEAAGLFATRFYESWGEGETAAVAARRGRDALRTELPHPYYWAAFFVVG